MDLANVGVGPKDRAYPMLGFAFVVYDNVAEECVAASCLGLLKRRGALCQAMRGLLPTMRGGRAGVGIR